MQKKPEYKILPIKLIAIDLDGTLLKNDHTICQYSHEMLKKAKIEYNIKIIISTIRAFHRSKDIYDAIGFDDPLICSCGAEIYNSKDTGVDVRYRMPKEAAILAADFANNNKIPLSISQDDKIYRKRIPGQENVSNPGSGIHFINEYNEALLTDPLRILATDSDKLPELVDFCKKHISDMCNLEVTSSPDGKIQLTVISRNASKGKALEYVCIKNNIMLSEVMAIGDSYADKSMLDVAGFPVVMGNAPDALKNSGYYITETNENCGVGKAIEMLFELN